jgi:O-antigen/teichoic acid export membrane protein
MDYLLISIALYVIYRKKGGQKLNVSFTLFKEMFTRSRYYIVSGMMVTIFSQTDKIMLKLMIDESATGLYSAALTCATMTSFVYAAIVDSLRPIILKNKQTSNMETFEKNNIYLYSIVIYLSLIQGIMMCMFAPLIVKILYGCEYMDAIMPLQIMAFYPLFSNIGMVRNVWILAQEKQKYLWIINLTGAVANILLNFILIPIFGISGAAIASVLTQIIANVVIGFVLKSIRENNRLMLKSLNLSCILRVLKKHK